MFGNTQSPGGIRRGPIWQSSDMGNKERDLRYLIYSDGDYSNILYGISSGGVVYSMNSGGLMMPDIASSAHGYQEIRPDVSDAQTFNYINYPYHIHYDTTSDPDGMFMDEFAHEKSMVIDVDLYVDPYMGSYCNPNGPTILVPTVTHHTDPLFSYDGWTNVLQFGSGEKFDAKVYSQLIDGQSVQGYSEQLTNAVDKRLQRDRAVIPCCPMRIKGKMVYSDYCFAMSATKVASAAAARAAIAVDRPNGFQASIATEFFEQKLATEMPSYDHQGFRGAGVQSPPQGSIYQSFTLGGYQDHTSSPLIDLTDNRNGNESTQRYHYCRGNVYGDNVEGNSDITFYFSPCIYPMYYNGNHYAGLNQGDMSLTLATSHARELQIKDARDYLFAAHADPGFLSPILQVPILTAVNTEPGQSGDYGAWNRPYIRSRHVTEPNPTNNWSRALRMAPYGSGTDDATEATGLRNFDICAAHGIYRTGRGSGEPTYFRAGPSSVNLKIEKGIIQPEVNLGVKYLQDVDSACASYIAIAQTSGAFSGRYKFIGFKGTISFFETTKSPRSNS